MALVSARVAAAAERFRLRIWGWCLMGNHIHLVAVPERRDSLARTIGLAHGRHARVINAARGWTGHLWANRYYSAALGGAHLWNAIRYVELNPVRAGLVRRAERWTWSSARAHALGEPDPMLDSERPFAAGVRDPMTGRFISWADWLARGLGEDETTALREATRTGRPLGDELFIKRLEAELDRILVPQKRTPNPASRSNHQKSRGYSNETRDLFSRLSPKLRNLFYFI